MRILKWVGGILAVAALVGALVFFGNFFSKSDSSSETSTSSKTNKSKSVSVTSTSDDDEYKIVVKDGQYVTSKARGITVSANDSTFNTMSFESGLLNVAKSHFSTKKFVFQEGQYLTAATATKWLARQSDDNKLGLNPADNGKTDDGRAPMYVQTIEEQDFMTQDGSDLKLGGIVIGIAMNTVDSYQKEQYGATFTQKISDADRIAKGKEIAAEVITRYRQMSGVSSTTPIVVAMYAEAASDSLVGGTFYSWAQSKSGDNLSGWTDLKYANVVLPTLDGASDAATSLAASLNTSFKNFQTQVEGFFPTVASISGQAQYMDSNLQGLNVTISTQFYSQTEIQSFANYLATQAPNYLPNAPAIQIRIQSSVGMQAILVKDANASTYKVIMLGSY